MAELVSRHRQRGTFQRTITLLEKTLHEWENGTRDKSVEYLKTVIKNLEYNLPKFEAAQDRLEELDERECPKRENTLQSYFTAISKARTFINQEERPATASISQATTPGNTQRTSPSIKLPTISLPTFNGNVEGWASFYDLFSFLIDQNEDLSPVIKLQYLRASLSETAAHSIESLETTEQNYEIALEILKRKYQCTRRTIHRHWTILREYPKLPRDTPEALNKLVETVYQNTRALENLKAPVKHWDVPLIDVILSKLSSNTIWQWELTLTDKQKVPKYTELVEFLEKRANCVDFTSDPSSKIMSRESSINKSKKQFNSVQTFATAPENPPAYCRICSSSHSIYQCEKLLGMNFDDRREAIKKAGLCINCFGKGHLVKECRSIPCKICFKRHHTLLHIHNESQPNNFVNGTASTENGQGEAQQA